MKTYLVIAMLMLLASCGKGHKSSSSSSEFTNQFVTNSELIDELRSHFQQKDAAEGLSDGMVVKFSDKSYSVSLDPFLEVTDLSDPDAFPVSYNLGSNALLIEALNANPFQVVQREVEFDGRIYNGFGIQVENDSPPPMNYTEYVVVPELPILQNPVQIRNAYTEESVFLDGVIVR